jgi:decaprenylphospho-beta-D-ribofuranose 2-oxidase
MSRADTTAAGASAADPIAAEHTVVPQGQLRVLSGWGNTAPSAARVLRPRTSAEAAQALAVATAQPGGAIARGAGRSYGDVAQNGGGSVIDTTGLRGVLDLDAAGGLVRVGAGTTLVELLSYLMPHGLTLAVMPGTRHVTVAGAVAADVHGKNHPRDGSFVEHVQSLALCTPDGEVLEVSRERQPELLHATAGGMGLTGVIVEATLRTWPLHSPWVSADIDRVGDVEGALALMGEGGEGKGSEGNGQRGLSKQPRYAIAWVDLLSHGGAWGRAVVTRSDDVVRGDASGGYASSEGASATGPPPGKGHRGSALHHNARPPHLAAQPILTIPRGFPRWMLCPASVRAFNAWHWRSAAGGEHGRLLNMQANLFPLDVLGAWNRLYGPAGLVQYQFAIPHGAEGALTKAMEHLRGRRLPVYLASIKRFGGGSGGLLSFPLPGWTLAVDIPADAPGLRAALDELDELVVGAGGRVYLAKDVRLRSHMLGAMYPELPRFRRVRERVDPRGVLRSDMARRLGLCAEDER